MRRPTDISIAILLLIGSGWLAACGSAANTASSSIARPAPLNASLLTPDPDAASRLPSLPSDPAGQSRVLTDYLKAHNLPLVGASMVSGPSGRQLTLYGFVATDQGKADAENDVRRVLQDPHVAVVNRIVVKPELLAMSQSANSGNSVSSGDSLPGVAQYENYPSVDSAYTSSQIQQYQAHQQGQADWTSWIVPAIMIGLVFVP